MRLFDASSIERFLDDNAKDLVLPSLCDYLQALCSECEVDPSQVMNRGGIERSYGNRIFSGLRNPSRDTVLKLAFGFGLNVDETQQLLKVAREALLHPKIKRDAVIAYCLRKGCSYMDVQQALYDFELPLLGGKRGA